MLDEDVLTIGFARRVPSYKRLTLMLHDPARSAALLLDPQQPVQIVMAGKAHPADEGGKGLIQQMVQFADDADVRHRIVFLPDYDMDMAHALVQGCDVWLNNPLRPLEACGTSGMKAALNGGLNVSVRDGWWDEWYDGENGWAIPSADGVADADRRDELEAAALYELLSKSVAPLFYDRRRGRRAAGLGGEGPAHVPLARPEGAGRADGQGVRDGAVRARGARPSRALADAERTGFFAAARELAAWKRRVMQAWPQVRIEHVEAEAAGQAPGSSALALTVRVGGARRAHPGRRGGGGGLRPARRRRRDRPPAYATLTPEPPAARTAVVRYSGEVSLDRPGPFGYTVRVLPNHPLLDSRAELGLVTYPQAPAGMTNGDLR